MSTETPKPYITICPECGNETFRVVIEHARSGRGEFGTVANKWNRIIMCNCIKEAEEKIKAKMEGGEDLGNWKPKDGNLTGVLCANRPYKMPSFRPTLTIPFTVSWDTPKRNKETTVNVEASHCPFCGVAFDSGSDGKAVESKFEDSK